MTTQHTFILGAGITGLASGIATGYPIFEMNQFSGGICSSYYLKPGSTGRDTRRDSAEESYRFEYGGGHWIFGNDAEVLEYLSQFDVFNTYQRRSSVFFREMDLMVPFPVQNNLRSFPDRLREQMLSELTASKQATTIRSMSDWCEYHFGRQLSALFFHPFHHLYTAGLWRTIAPQDGYKSPVSMQHILAGATGEAGSAGYNVTFRYPQNGLNTVTSGLQARCDIRFGKQVSSIDVREKLLSFSDHTTQPYDRLISTLPLNVLQHLTGITTTEHQDPYTSVLVLNIGARTGPKECKDHWIYMPSSEAGFHRIGFYSNVDASFLPRAKRNGSYVSLYVERSFPGGHRPNDADIDVYEAAVVRELQSLGFIGETDVIDRTWIDVAYTWSYPGSTWSESMISAAARHDIVSIGRYGRWKFQGIHDSIKEGLSVGAVLKGSPGSQ